MSRQEPPSSPLPPSVQSTTYQEMQVWLQRMTEDAAQLSRRNFRLRLLLILGILFFLVLLWQIHAMTIGRYAVLRDIKIVQNPCHQGQLDISFEVVEPGIVYCRRVCDDIQTDIIDDYFQPGHYVRPWSWTYRPGHWMDVSIWSRSWGLCLKTQAQFPTAEKLDWVILIDTTGSMDRSLQDLKEKCVTFADKLKTQSLEPRFALIGFGDTQDGEWLAVQDFTDNMEEFQESVEKIPRFDGGDLPESALDALVEAMKLVEKSSGAGSVKRFYLVTDESFHEKTADGRFTAEDVGKLLRSKGILLDVFSRPEYSSHYEPLLGPWGHFWEIENFGKVLEEGRVLED
ncbi:MAG: vWA domain-containing protein [Planctomycetia bacterium]|nr:vWA domain-containing protein [Planctomycetia bacterium]